MTEEPINLQLFKQELKGYLDRRDKIGRKDFFTWDPLRFIAAMPQLYLPRMRKVPEQGIAEVRDHEVLLNCPCGHHPTLDRDADSWVKCSGCERNYLELIPDAGVYVLYGAMPVPRPETSTNPANPPQ
jgi:hypothetical protein